MRKSFLAGAAALVAASSLATVGAAFVTGGVAGANTVGYKLSCTTSNPAYKGLVGSVALPGTVTTGSLPASVKKGAKFTLSNYKIKITLPSSGIFADAAGLTLAGSMSTWINSSDGATPATKDTTLTLPSTTIPTTLPKAGVSIAIKGGTPTFTAPKKPGTKVTLTAGAKATLTVTVKALGVSVPLSCSYPKPTKVIASIKVTS